MVLLQFALLEPDGENLTRVPLIRASYRSFCIHTGMSRSLTVCVRQIAFRCLFTRSTPSFTDSSRKKSSTRCLSVNWEIRTKGTALCRVPEHMSCSLCRRQQVRLQVRFPHAGQQYFASDCRHMAQVFVSACLLVSR